MEEIKASITELPTVKASMSAFTLQAVAGATSHTELSERDAADQHPISAIIGLSDALDGKLSESELGDAVDSALLRAKESGDFNGTNGISPTVKASKSGKTTTLTFTDAAGTKTATVLDGEDGEDGKDGISPTVSVSKSGKTTTLTITDASGTKTATILDGNDGSGSGTGGYTPVKGVDYYTDEDKAEMVELVLAALPTWEGGSY